MASRLPPMTRRAALRAAAALAAWPLSGVAGLAGGRETPARAVTRGRLRQSVSRWCYKDIPLPDLCRAVAAMGVPAIDLLEAADWPVVREHGLVCSMGYGGGGTISDGLNNPANHDRDRHQPHRGHAEGGGDGRAQPDHVLRQSAGPRRQRGDRQPASPASTGSRAPAEQHGVTICVELLNSKVEPPGLPGRPHRRSAWRW